MLLMSRLSFVQSYALLVLVLPHAMNFPKQKTLWMAKFSSSGMANLDFASSSGMTNSDDGFFASSSGMANSELCLITRGMAIRMAARAPLAIRMAIQPAPSSGWRTGWRRRAIATSRHPRIVGLRAPGFECGGWFTYHHHPRYRDRSRYQARCR